MNATLDRDTAKSYLPTYIETIVVNQPNPHGIPLLEERGLELWASIAFDGLNATLSVGEGTHNPQPPMTMTGWGARQLAAALNRLADRIDDTPTRLLA
jgi:hypothetical protein